MPTTAVNAPEAHALSEVLFAPTTALDSPPPAAVLRLAILIADAAGEILYWNAEAQEALERLPGKGQGGRLNDVFAPEVLERLRAIRSWVVVKPAGAPGVAWKVRTRHLLDSGRSMFLFFSDATAS